MENGNFSWGDEETVLKNINFRVDKGKLAAVVGTVGSGKSSLLSALLGEMEKISGRVNTLGKIAYVSQVSFIYFFVSPTMTLLRIFVILRRTLVSNQLIFLSNNSKLGYKTVRFETTFYSEKHMTKSDISKSLQPVH